ncbi:MAG TPA: hypothetical protein DIW24_01405 [Bacteroidetes bacterium]|nr:hypothetical protein [Bacteroidota bacterium]HRR07613.1 hypothetical protein [Rhodothermales bacterium]
MNTTQTFSKFVEIFKKQLFAILISALVLLIIIGLVRFGEWYYYLGLAGSFKQSLMARTSLGPDLAEALAWLYAAAFSYFVMGIILSKRDFRRGIALWLASFAILPVMAALFPKPLPQCLALNPATGKMTQTDCHPSGVHPEWHTPEFPEDKILVKVQADLQTVFFTTDNQPMLAYVEEENGELTFYNKPGMTPDGKIAVWVSKSVVTAWIAHQKRALEPVSRKRRR